MCSSVAGLSGKPLPPANNGFIGGNGLLAGVKSGESVFSGGELPSLSGFSG